MRIATSTAPHRTARPAPAVAPQLDQPYLPGRYFTNGAALYRIVGWLHRPSEPPLAQVEDCATLHLALLTREELAMMALRPVRLAAR